MASESTNSRTLDYAAHAQRPSNAWLVAAILSVTLSILEYPWLFIVGWVAWAFIVGDNQPTKSQNDLIGALLALPPLVAVTLGIGPVIQRRSRSARLIGALGLTLSVAWLWLLIPR